MISSYISILNKHPKVFLSFFLIALIFFSYSAKDFQIDASSDTLILEQDKDLKKFREINDNYGSNDFLIVTFTDVVNKKILSKDNLNEIKLFINQIKQLEWVDSVQSVFDVPLLEIRNQSLTDLVDEVLTLNSDGININEAEKELLSSPIFKNLIISEDASTTGVLINFKRDLDHEYLVNERDRLRSLQNFPEDINNLKKLDRYMN